MMTLLRNEIQPPSLSIRHNITSTGDIFNTLATYTLHRHTAEYGYTLEHRFHAHDLCKSSHTMQQSMNVNKNSLTGPTSIEFIGAHDLMEVKLVYKWFIN